MKYDFAQGYKTIAGIIVLALSVAGHSISNEDVLAIITGIGELIGSALTIYGLIMKMVRKIKGSEK